MAVFASTTTVDGDTLINWIGTTCLPQTEWMLSSNVLFKAETHYRPARTFLFQSPAYLSIGNDRCCYGRCTFPVACRNLCFDGKFNHIMMAMETSITKNGISYKQVEGTPIEEEELKTVTNTPLQIT